MIATPQISLDRLRTVADAWRALAGDPDPRAQEIARGLRLTLRDLALRIVPAGRGVVLEEAYILPWSDLLRPIDRAWLLDCGVAPELIDLLAAVGDEQVERARGIVSDLEHRLELDGEKDTT